MNIHSEAIDRLFESILKLESVEDCYKYFEDLCTVKEIMDMAQRLEAAILLDRGDSYQMIVEKTGLSTATIGRVSKCLNYGSGGYRETIARLGKNPEGKAASANASSAEKNAPGGEEEKK